MGTATAATLGWAIGGLLVLAACTGVAAAAAEDGIPREEKDVVFLADGRVIRCRAGPEVEGRVELEFTGGRVLVPADRILEIRRFADYDPEPRDDAERAQRDAGLVRWDGRWVEASKVEEALRADRERAESLWKEEASHLEWENRWKRNTRHYAIEANIPRENLELYERALEQFYEYFTSGFRVSLKRRIPVYILRTREEFLEFYRKDTGKDTEHAVGYFMPRRGKEHLVLFDWQGDRAKTLSVLFHECTHLLLHLGNPSVGLPPMLNEGLAEYYGASIMVKGKLVRGRVQDGRLLDLRAMIDGKTLPPLQDLLAHGHPDRGAGGWKELSPDDYAQSWAFIHFLFHGKEGKYQRRLVAWLNGHLSLKPRDADSGGSDRYYWMEYVDDRALLLRCLKAKEWEDVEKEYLDYVAGLRFDGPTGIITQGFRKLSREGDEAGAEADFEEALRMAGDDPAVLSLLVKAYSRIEGREELAEKLLLRVLDLDPLNVPLRYEMSSWFPSADTEVPHLQMCQEMAPGDPIALASAAWLAFMDTDRDRWVNSSPFASEPAQDARAALEEGKEIPPEDCLRMAEVLLTAGEPKPALEAARRAERGLPGDERALRALARAAACCGEAGEFARAVEELRAAWKEEGAGPRLSPSLRVSGVVVEAACLALACEEPAALRRVLDPWFGKEGRGPRLEAEWILHLATALITEDYAALLARARVAARAMAGSERVGYLARSVLAAMEGEGEEEE